MTDRETRAVERAVVATLVDHATPSLAQPLFPITAACRAALRANQDRRRLLDARAQALDEWDRDLTPGRAA